MKSNIAKVRDLKLDKFQQAGICIVDNFLNELDHYDLQMWMSTTDTQRKQEDKFYWEYNAGIVNEKIETEKRFFMVAPIIRAPDVYTNGEWTPQHFDTAKKDIINMFLKPLGMHCIARIQVNLTHPEKENRCNLYHFDYDYEYARKHMLTAIYYVHDTDGPTRFRGIGDVECKANRIVVFPTNTMHAGVSHTTSGPRIAINFNFYPYDFRWQKPQTL